MDIDIAIDILPEQAEGMVAAMRGEFHIEESAAMEAIQRKTQFNVIHLESMQKVDLFVLGEQLFERQEIERGQSVLLGGEPEIVVRVASTEDVVLHKLLWYREGGGVSDRQWRDVLGVLKVQRDRLDDEHLWKWADALGVADLLRQVMREAGLSE